MKNHLVGGYSIIEIKAGPNTDVEEKKLPKESQIERQSLTQKWASWGDDNLLPNRIIEAVQKDEVVFQSNEFNKASHYGSGLNYYIEERTKDGIIKNYSAIPEVDEWIEENDANALFLEMIEDYETVGNWFASIVLNKGRTKAARLLRKQATWCRWAKQDTITRLVDTMYYNSDWAQNAQEYIQEFKVLNHFSPIKHLEQLAASGSGNEFIYRTKTFTANRFYYDLANVEVLINSGNLEMKDLLKAAYKSLTKNSLGVAFHIEVTEEYCKRRVNAADMKKWETDATFRTEILAAIKKEVDEWLTGPANQGKTLLTMKFMNNRTQQYESGVTVTALDDKVKQDKWLPSMQQYHAETYNAMGVDPSNTGISNKNDGMNSGSEKKNAFFNNKATLGIDRLNTLMPFQFVARFNGWTKNYKGFKWEVMDEYPHLDIAPNSNKTVNNTGNAN
jgi:hypothetical protein